MQVKNIIIIMLKFYKDGVNKSKIQNNEVKKQNKTGRINKSKHLLRKPNKTIYLIRLNKKRQIMLRMEIHTTTYKDETL